MRRRGPRGGLLPGLALVAGLVLAGCAREAPAPRPSSAQARDAEVVTLTSGHGPLQVTPDLRLATGNFWREETDGGVRQPTAALFLFDLRTGPPNQRHVRVHAGQVVEAADQEVEVVEVVERGDSGPELRVRLRSRKP
ncbi:hypothetical protein [Pyxidicoccus trucidator]|uniref:hypothetical protein n=1 Tax=Pyxidicoccus trucidator TaxID=2709662 RepID=UPI0013D9A111|nr:hypothetical protein [Pyxidicoccus trucidator]